MFKLENIYYYLFAFIGFISILIFLYFWFKIISLNNENSTLEKKYQLLKKENKDLKESFSNIEKNNNNNASNDMSNIFNMLPAMLGGFNSLGASPSMQDFVDSECDPNINCDTYKCKSMFSSESFNNNPDISENIDKNDIDDIDDIVDKIIKPNSDDDTHDTDNIVDIVDKIIKPDTDDITITDTNSNIDTQSNISEQTIYSKSKLNKLNVDKLKEICINNQGSDEGTKQILIDRILNENYK